MTKILMNVFKAADESWHDWWWNFYNHYTEQGVDMNDAKEITRTLALWNAIDEDPESSEFYFTSEHDYTMFMLRWS